jgi:hypothetical protein
LALEDTLNVFSIGDLLVVLLLFLEGTPVPPIISSAEVVEIFVLSFEAFLACFLTFLLPLLLAVDNGVEDEDTTAVSLYVDADFNSW